MTHQEIFKTKGVVCYAFLTKHVAFFNCLQSKNTLNNKILCWIAYFYVLFINLTESFPVCAPEVSCSFFPSVFCSLVCSLTDVARKSNNCLSVLDIFLQSRHIINMPFCVSNERAAKSLVISAIYRQRTEQVTGIHCDTNFNERY